MKIIHVITGLNDGGAEAVLYRLCKFDKSNKHQIVSLSNLGKYGLMLKILGLKVDTFNMSPGRFSLISFFRLIRLLRNEMPDVVQTWMYHGDFIGGLAARISGIRAIVWGIHHTTLDPKNSKKTTILIANLSAKLSSFIPKKIIVCSKRGIDVHKKLGYDSKKMYFVPNGYDLNDFQPSALSKTQLKSQLGLEHSIPLIGSVGRFDPQKDQKNLLEALMILIKKGVSFQCILVGTGLDQSNKKIVELINKFDLSDYVKLLGQRNDIPNIMNTLDLHILSSAYGEAFPNVINEAMACGTPCVVTDVGDSANIVGDTGWVAPPSDPEALANVIEIALQDLTKGTSRDKRSISARDRIEKNFSIKRMVNSYSEIWNSISSLK